MTRSWWKPLLYAGLAAVAVSLVVVLSESDNAELIDSIFLILLLPCSLLAAGVLILTGKGLPAMLVVVSAVVYFAMSAFILLDQHNLRTPIRWALHSHAYKTQVLTQPSLNPVSLRHIEWDSWGWAAVGDTYVYLVYDPEEQLAAPRKDHSGLHAKFYLAQFRTYIGLRSTGTP